MTNKTYTLTKTCPYGTKDDTFIVPENGYGLINIDTGVRIGTDPAFFLIELGILIEKKEEVWPEWGDTYWFITSEGKTGSNRWIMNKVDLYRRDFLGIFRTEKEALARRDEIKGRNTD